MQTKSLLRISGRVIFLVLVSSLAEGGLSAFAQNLNLDPKPKNVTNARQQIKANLHPDAFNAKLIGRVAASTTIRLAIGLVIPKNSELQATIKDMYDPASPNYRRFLTSEQFTAQYAPSAGDYQAVLNWAKSNHLRVERTYPNRLLVSLSGSAANVERAVHVSLEEALRADQSKFYRSDRDPSIQLSVPIGSITGLDNFERPTHYGGSSPVGSYISKDLRKAYADGSQLTGRDQTIGIMAFDGYLSGDIDNYRTDAHLSSLAPGQLTNVFAAGISSILTPNLWSNAETTADIELAMAMAPDAKVKVYIGDWSSTASCIASFDSLITSMVADTQTASSRGTMQFSNSYGCLSWSTTMYNALSAMAMQGQSFFVPAGDYGGSPNGLAPYSDLMVTIVGGTTLTMSGNGVSRTGEVPWDVPASGVAGGGGVGTALSSPSYQTGTVYASSVGASLTSRNEPDLSIVADGLYIRAHLPTNPPTYYNRFYGTSAGAPLMAGFAALVNERWALAGMSKGIGWVAPAVWNIGRNPVVYAQAFNDIDTGGTHSYQTPVAGPNYSATSGYDLATGWGTPKPALIDQLACVQMGVSGHVVSTPPNCEVSIGTSLGDPHITTNDGLLYDFQASGDFLLATTGPSFVVQARQNWTPSHPNVAINKAVAMQMGETRIAVFLDPLRLTVGGRLTSLQDGKSLSLPGNVEILHKGNAYLIKRKSGETVLAEALDSAWVGGTYMNVTVSLNYDAKGKMRGLLGNGNGNPLDDIATREGVVLTQPVSFGDLYRQFAESMHIQPVESLFGEERARTVNEAVFELPTRFFTVKNLAPKVYKSARAACQKAGVESATLLDACTLDVAVLGSSKAAKIYNNRLEPTAFLIPGKGIHYTHAYRNPCGKCDDSTPRLNKDKGDRLN